MSTYIVVGGVAGGATAATRLRRLDESAHIVMIERGEHVSYANCGLPYYVGGEIEQRESLLVATPASLSAEFDLDVRTRQEVVAIDRAAKEVEVRNLADGSSYRLAYDKLILSPGAQPFVPPIPGANAAGVYTLRTVGDSDAIKARLDAGDVRHAVVIGGGFIGLEMAENLVRRGVVVTVVELVNQVMISVDYDMAAPLHRHLREKGVRLSLGDGLKQIVPQADGLLEVVLESGRSTLADMVVLAIGVRPESTLAKAAGLTLGPRGHIVVDEVMRTSDPDIYAVGDVVQVTNPVTGQLTAVPLAGPANRQARIAADHINGRVTPYQGTLGTSIVKVFDLTLGRVGCSSNELSKLGTPYLASITHSQDHAGYYPGATPQTIKLLYATDTGRLLGAQVVGYNAVDRTINTLAVALKAGMTVYDLEHLELAYAPPYGSAKDPVNIAGFVAANALRGDTRLVQWHELDALLQTGEYRLLDVVSDIEYELGSIPGALHIPYTEVRQRIDELSRDFKWIVYCRIGRRGYVVERDLRQRGYDVRNLTGGYNVWSMATEEQSSFAPWTPAQAATPTKEIAMSTEPSATVELNACGLQCPGPILAVYKKMQELPEGAVLRVQATDPGFRRDVSAWAERTGNQVLDLTQEGAKITARLQKGAGGAVAAQSAATGSGKTIIVFDGNLDHAMAAFIIANGAAAMDQPVSVFFTFWGLNILRRTDPTPVHKTLIERMFGWMMPKGARKVKLSNLNMAGMGTAMMKGVMKSKNIDSLETLIVAAQENGVRLIACQMTMDMMGIKPEELLDGVEIGGVATMLNEADKGNGLLFI
ncbi:MAG: FAD-dependent oxidoreductase [Chloroflexi bacterium]|nr:FAD-dependent oxidoreductase [Chloroflexota bacterium]